MNDLFISSNITGDCYLYINNLTVCSNRTTLLLRSWTGVRTMEDGNRLRLKMTIG